MKQPAPVPNSQTYPPRAAFSCEAPAAAGLPMIYPQGGQVAMPPKIERVDDKDRSDGLRRPHALGIECDRAKDGASRTLHS